MTTTQLSVIPQGTQLPAHLQGPDAAARIAANMAAAASGIKAGGFPRLSLDTGKFNLVEGGETNTYMMAPLMGQPALPMMCFEAAVVEANRSPKLSRVLFKGAYVKGEVREPDCRSANGINPDPDVAVPESAACANCPQAAWGSKVSQFSGKDITACEEFKQLAILPAWFPGWTEAKMIGFAVHKGSLKNWKLYIADLNTRGFDVMTLVTNITFDATATGVLNFAFNRFHTEEEQAKLNLRVAGADVQVIVAQSRSVAAPLALPAPAPAAPPIPASQVPPTQPAPAPAPVQTGVVFATEPATFGAAPPSQPAAAQGVPPQINTAPAAAPAAAPTEPPKRTRRTRAQIAADEAAAAGTALAVVAGHPGFVASSIAHLDAATQATIAAVGGPDSPAGKAILAAFPPPTVHVPADPLAHLDAATKATITAVGGPDSVAGKAILAAFAVVQPKAAAAPAAPAEGDKPQPSGVTLPPPPAAPFTPPVPTTSGPVTTGFGAAPAPQPSVAPAAPSAAAMSLKALLEKKLGINQPAAG